MPEVQKPVLEHTETETEKHKRLTKDGERYFPPIIEILGEWGGPEEALRKVMARHQSACAICRENMQEPVLDDHPEEEAKDPYFPTIIELINEGGSFEEANARLMARHQSSGAGRQKGS